MENSDSAIAGAWFLNSTKPSEIGHYTLYSLVALGTRKNYLNWLLPQYMIFYNNLKKSPGLGVRHPYVLGTSNGSI